MSERESKLNYLPLLFVLLPPLAWFTALYFAFVLVDLTPLRLVVYSVYALATTVVALACITLCRRSSDGKVPVMLVGLTYEATALAIALWGILALLIIRLAFPSLATGEADFAALVLQALSYAMISGSAAAAAISAALMVYGLYSDRLYLRIPPSPWGALRLMRYGPRRHDQTSVTARKGSAKERSSANLADEAYDPEDNTGVQGWDDP